MLRLSFTHRHLLLRLPHTHFLFGQPGVPPAQGCGAAKSRANHQPASQPLNSKLERRIMCCYIDIRGFNGNMLWNQLCARKEEVDETK